MANDKKTRKLNALAGALASAAEIASDLVEEEKKVPKVKPVHTDAESWRLEDQEPEGDEDEDGETDGKVPGEAEQDDKPANHNKPKKENPPAKSFDPENVADIISSKGLKLDYNPIGDFFSFKRSGGGNVRLAPESTDELEFLGMKSASVKRKSMEPTDEELAKINQFTGRPHQKHEVSVVTIKAADSKVDRSHEHFSKKALDSMAAMSINKPLMNDHNIHDVKDTFGNIFDAKVVSSKSGPVLMQKAYVLNAPENDFMIKQLAAGIGAKASVHFRAGREDYLCDTCNKAMFSSKGFCGHYVGLPGGAEGKVTTATINNVKDFLETSRTGAPDQPETDMKMYSEEQISGAADEFVEAFGKSVDSAKPAEDYRLSSFVQALQKGIVASESKLTKDSTDRGANTVDDESKKKEAEAAAAAAAEAAALSHAAPHDEVGKFVKSVEQLEGTVGSFNGSIDALKSVIASVGAAVEKQAAFADDFQKSIEAEKSAREAQVKELGDRFDLLFVVHQKTAELLADLGRKVDLATAKSIDEMVHKLAAIIPPATAQQGSVSDQEKAANERNDFYADHMAKYKKLIK